MCLALHDWRDAKTEFGVQDDSLAESSSSHAEQYSLKIQKI
jgi:hypothetical protein